MKVLHSWLRELAPLEATPEEISAAFNDLGTPVEEVTAIGGGLDGIVVARVLDLRSHPEADRIQLVDVDAGDGEALQIACGAFNMAVGDLVPLATLGTTMPDGMEIARRKMRGEWSNGMLCSTAELGLGADHGGIRVLPAGLVPGTPVADALGIVPDVLWDLEVNANRPDALCVAGLARDLAAHLGVPFSLPAPEAATGGAPAADALGVEIVDADLCGRFGAWLLRGLDPTATSPEWMQQRLTHLGMRPISALVDISNYVMLELGQPNHPYDLAGVPGGRFRVRRARAGESLTTLDDVARTLSPDDLLICGGDDVPLGIAGVMGGAAAEISATTTDVALEMAWFLPRAVGTTARRLGLRTEAAARFERGCDPEVIPVAAARFAALAAEICGTTLAPGAVDERGELPDRTPIRLRPARVAQVLGADLDAPAIAALLDPIGFTTTPAGGELDVALPSWRYDSTTEVDVIEEVARHFGYANIARRELATATVGALTAVQRRRREVRRLLTGLGLDEVMPLPFLAPGALATCGLPGDSIELRNSLVADESVLRPSLLPGLVQAVATNAARRSTGVRLFEVGHVFLPRDPGAPVPDGPGRPELLPDEREHLGVALAGAEAPEAVRAWYALAERLGLADVDVANEPRPGLHPSRSAVARVGGEVVGAVGEVDPGVLEAHGVAERVAWLEVDLGRLLGQDPADTSVYRKTSRFPSSDIDLSFVVPDPVSAIDVERTLEQHSMLVWKVDLIDRYRGEGVPEGARSLTYRIRFDAPDRTLTDAEVAAARQVLIDAVTSIPGTTLRG